MKVLSENETTAMLNRVIESQAKRIAELEAQLGTADAYLAKVEGYAAGYHEGYADGQAA